MSRKVEIDLEYQNYIENAPVSPQQLYSQACSNDTVTVDSWRHTWIRNITENHKNYGPFKDKSIGIFFNINKHRPTIIAGSGPSLKYNGMHLKDRGDITLVSCLHNFHFMEDNNANVDFYVTLDSGEVTVEEVYEGGTKTPEEYWALTKNRKLIAYTGTSPALLAKWQGEIYFYNCPIPQEEIMKEIEAVEQFHCYLSTGGNVLGACLYFAKAFLGSNPIAFVGADFSFSYGKKFHAWDSKYDKSLGYVIKMVDVFGNKCLSWQSYANFKAWFDYIVTKVPGLYVNCTEGGCFGSYNEGNIMHVKQQPLKGFLETYNLNELLRDQAETPEKAEKRILF